MALQNRYGDYSNFDPDKMVTGEIAVVVSGDPNSENGRSVYVCFAPGIVKRFTTYSDFESEIQNATEDVQNQFTEEIRLTIESAVEETARATNAAEAAQTAAENAIEAAAAANAAAGGDISNKTVTFSTSSNRELLTSGENTSGLFGKIAKWFSDLKNAAFCDVANNLVTTEEGYLLDARQGKILDDKISEQNTKIGQIYTCDANFVNPNGQWTTGASLTLPAGVYIVIRRGHSMDNTKSIKLGESWEVGKYASGYDAVEYTKILSSETEFTIVNFIYGNTDITNGIIAVKLK